MMVILHDPSSGMTKLCYVIKHFQNGLEKRFVSLHCCAIGLYEVLTALIFKYDISEHRNAIKMPLSLPFLMQLNVSRRQNFLINGDFEMTRLKNTDEYVDEKTEGRCPIMNGPTCKFVDDFTFLTRPTLKDGCIMALIRCSYRRPSINAVLKR